MKVEVDDRELRVFLERLQSQRMLKQGKAAIRKGLRILAKKTTDNFRAKRRGYTERKRSYTTRTGRQRTKTQRIATVSYDKKDKRVVKVHIMADPLVRFFEKGTKERKTKSRHITGSVQVGKRKYLVREGKGHATGRIRPEWFFRDAQRQTAQQVRQKIDEEMRKAISRMKN